MYKNKGMAIKSSLATAAHYKWGNNCDSWELLKNKNLSVKFEKMPAGTAEQNHLHTAVQQYFFMLKGCATFEIENETVQLEEKEGIHVNPGASHRISNPNNYEIEFLVISQPEVGTDRINTA